MGGFLAILGVIAAPITSGDTAFRSARLIVADFLRVDQKPILKRLMISVPLFVAGYIILHANFSVLWRYFAWCNQTLAVFTLWALTVYLTQKRKPYVITLIPALFMTAVCSTYILIAREGLHLPQELAYWARRSRYPVHIRPVPRVAQQIPAAESDDLTGTDSSIKRKGIFMRKIPFRLIPAAAVPPARKRFAS